MVEVKRDKTLDGLKFLLISLVIFGHAIEPTRYINSFSGILYSIIYSFHMPLFVMLSGYFSKKICWVKLNQQALILLETYLVMAVTMGLVLGYGLRLVVFPSMSCWYLLSLIFWRYMLYWFINRKKCKSWWLILYSVLIMFASFVLPINKDLSVLSFMRSCQYFFFFVIGYCISEDFIAFLRNNIICKSGLWLATIVLFYFIWVYSSRELHVLEFHRDTMVSLIDQFNWSPFLVLLYKCIILIIALIVSFTFLTIRKFPKCFEKLGRYTLSFFFLQGIIIHKMVLVLPFNIYLELIVSVGVILLGGYIGNKLSWAMNPISTTLRYIKENYVR